MSKEELIKDVVDANKEDEMMAHYSYKKISEKLAEIPKLSKIFKSMSENEKEHAGNIDKMACLVEQINDHLQVYTKLETKVSDRRVKSISDLLTILKEHPDVVKKYLNSCEL